MPDDKPEPSAPLFPAQASGDRAATEANAAAILAKYEALNEPALADAEEPEAPVEAEGAGDDSTDAEAAEDAPEAEVEAEEEEAETPAAADEPVRLGIRALDNAQFIALRRAQIDDETIDALPDDALIRLADRLAAQERRNKEHFESLKSQQPERPEGRKREETEGVQASPPTPEPAPKVAPRNLPEPVRAALGLDAEEVKPLEEWLHGTLSETETRVRAEAQARIEAAEKAAKAAQDETRRTRALIEQQMATAIRADLAKADWPEIAAPDVWARVMEAARVLAPAYASDDLDASMRRLLHDSAFRVIGPPKSALKAAAKTPIPAKGADKATPQLSRPGRKASSPPRKLSVKELTERNAREAARKHGIAIR